SLQTNCPNGCIDDNDVDGYGLGCPAGFDCDGEDRRAMGACDNDCIQDTDGDGFGIGCADGLDCNGRHPDFTQDCTNGCIFDEDGDGRGFGCDLGNDCNGINPFRFEGCANNCISDNEGDAAGWGCDGGADCNDTDPFVEECLSLTGCVDDHDGDGYGTGCELGADCDDYDFSVALDCTGNCTFDEDCNGLPDGWQEGYFNNTVCDDPAFCDAGADPDEDGFSNIEEFRRGTNPLLKEEVALPPEMPAAVTDTDGDGMSDECERLYDLDYENPDDAARDYDNDGLLNQEECNYRRGMCRNSGLSPISPDHDGDGYADPDEIDAGTDPCDPESRPSRSWIGILLVILGILCILGSTGYLVYKKYYVPLVSPPPKPTAVQSARPLARPPGARLPGVRHHLPRGLPPRPRGPVFSRTQFEDEMRKRADARESVLKAFGEKKARPRKVMEAIARRPGAAGRAGARPGRAAGMPGISVRKVEPAPAAKPGAKPSGKDYVSQLTKVVGKDSFERIAALSKQEADYMGRLATIAKRKEVPLEHDHVSKLAAISKKVAGDRPKKEELEKAFRKSDTDELDAFLSSRKHVETFIKEAEPGKAEPGKEEKTGHKPAAKGASKAGGDDFDKLAGIAGKAKGGFDALEDLSKAKRKDVISSLQEMSSKRAQKTAMSKIGTLSDAGSKEEIFREFEKMGREAHVDKNVFEVLLSYLMKSGKITKHDVGEILLELEKSGVLSKKDVSDVFFNLGMKDMPL
ncbi:hypothetical protein KY362_03350, partial [Candidatus Woesearchaeota archaeon]|nr:hypothetical protein [Candidatus Woesearchaeota archaeon]